MIEYPKAKVCAAHVAPVFLDSQATIQKACALIAEAAAAGAQLIAFPESFVPGFPIWAAVQAPIKNHEYFKRLAANSIEVPGPEVQQLCEAAREHNIIVSIGISERTQVSVGCLWNSNLLIGNDGTILNHHRKLVPTFYEKLVWANGDGAGLRVSDTPIGKIGMLICGENTNPLARYSLIAQGEQIHISSYPPVWPTRPSNEPGRYDLASAIRIQSRRSFVRRQGVQHRFLGVFGQIDAGGIARDRSRSTRDYRTKSAGGVHGAWTIRRNDQRYAL